MNLLIESADFSLTENKIVSEENNDKKYVIEGIFLQSNIKNGNGRIYPEQVMDNAANIWISKYMSANRGVGELEHPEATRTQQIVLKEVSHKITVLKKQGTDYWGRAEITKNTKNGGIVCGLMDAGITLGTSSRATGSTKKQGDSDIVQNDFRLITPSDIVFEPSAPDALVTSIMENKEWLFENGVLVEREINGIQKHINNSIRNKTFDDKELFNSILNMLKNN